MENRSCMHAIRSKVLSHKERMEVWVCILKRRAL
jgi:hypothetical protein